MTASAAGIREYRRADRLGERRAVRMCENSVDSDGVVIDVTGLSLRDLDKIDTSSLAQAIHMVLNPANEEEIRGFNSRI
jgi:hypothetical protein